jgi:hypothetical protein
LLKKLGKSNCTSLAMFKNKIRIFAIDQTLKNCKYRQTQRQMHLPTKSVEEHTTRNIKRKSKLNHFTKHDL